LFHWFAAWPQSRRGRVPPKTLIAAMHSDKKRAVANFVLCSLSYRQSIVPRRCAARSRAVRSISPRTSSTSEEDDVANIAAPVKVPVHEPVKGTRPEGIENEGTLAQSARDVHADCSKLRR
jgi:hypothetical protein